MRFSFNELLASPKEDLQRILLQLSPEGWVRMSFAEIRELGKKIGVKSPTSKNKAVIIQEAIEILKGEKLPADLSSRGRPYKKKEELNDTEFEVAQNAVNIVDKLSNTPNDILNDECTKNIEFSYSELDVCGVLEVAENFGFLRAENYCVGTKDIFVPLGIISRLKLRNGDFVSGKARKNDRSKCPSLVSVSHVNNREIDGISDRLNYDDLKAIYSKEVLKLEKSGNISLRMIDLVSPIGKGQRGIIAGPIKAGKTTLLKLIAKTLKDEYQKIHLLVLLIDSRIEEVNEIKDYVGSEVIYSTFDNSPSHHVQVSELVLKRAKRLVEMGEDVVILLDSINSLAKAYNQIIPSVGRSVPTIFDSSALMDVKKFFAAAKNTEEGGSLTIIATSTIDSGNNIDQLISQEINSSANLEIYLMNSLCGKVFPPINIIKSFTRQANLLLSKKEYDCMLKIKKIVEANPVLYTEQLQEAMVKTKTNNELIDIILKGVDK